MPGCSSAGRRWSRVLVALFAVGVITGTILSFQMGLLWPNFTGTFGSVFGVGFAIEGFSFFMEAIFIGIYVYGWDRLSPRRHLLSGIPIVITGITGSLMVGGVLLAFPLGALLGVDPAYVYGSAVVVGAIGAILLILRSAWPKNEPPPVPPTY